MLATTCRPRAQPRPTAPRDLMTDPSDVPRPIRPPRHRRSPSPRPRHPRPASIRPASAFGGAARRRHPSTPGFAIPAARSRARRGRPAARRTRRLGSLAASVVSRSSPSSSSRVASPWAMRRPQAARSRRVPPPASARPRDLALIEEAWKHDPRQLRRRQEPRRPGPRVRRHPGLTEAVGDEGHTSFLTADEAKAADQSLSGTFVGIGVQIDTDEERTARRDPLGHPEHPGRGGRASSAATGSSRSTAWTTDGHTSTRSSRASAVPRASP